MSSISGNSAAAPADLPSDFFGGRTIVYPVRVLDKTVLWRGDQPREHVLVRWSDGSASPTWEPVDVVKRNFPNVLLEDKDVAMERGVDTLPSTAQQQQEAETEQRSTGSGQGELVEAPTAGNEASIAKTEPKRNVKPPNKFGDFVAK